VVPFSPTDVLELRDLTAGYRDVDVLHGVSGTFAASKITAVIGPNGAGKSTLLKTIFGMAHIRSGEIVYDGCRISGRASRDILAAGIAYVPQGRCNFPAMTVEENLLLGGHTRRRDKGLRRDIDLTYDEFPMLRDKRRTLAGYLSGGQQQILEMAMALILRPRLLLIDEPSLGLSPVMVEQVFARIRDINQRGTTVIMVEQNARQALAISHDGLVLELGRTRREARAADLLVDPEISRLYLGG
jgi:branched-chain amino acid transport system ATP-binding protein